MYTINVRSTDYLILSEVLLINYFSIDTHRNWVYSRATLSLVNEAACVRVCTGCHPAVKIIRKLSVLRQSDGEVTTRRENTYTHITRMRCIHFWNLSNFPERESAIVFRLRQSSFRKSHWALSVSSTANCLGVISDSTVLFLTLGSCIFHRKYFSLILTAEKNAFVSCQNINCTITLFLQKEFFNFSGLYNPNKNAKPNCKFGSEYFTWHKFRVKTINNTEFSEDLI